MSDWKYIFLLAVLIGALVGYGAWPGRNGRPVTAPSEPTALSNADNPFRQDRPFVRRWSMADFAGRIDLAEAKRDLQRGKAIFVAAACIQCHQARGVGSELGPTLTAIANRRSPRQILRDTIEPGAEINKDYQTQLLLTEDGKQYTGIVARENQSTIWLATDPLNDDQLTVVQKQDVDERLTSAASSMPTGLLDHFSRGELLDLIAFLCSGLNR